MRTWLGRSALLVSASWDKSVIVWDLTTGKKVVSFKAHPESVCDLALGPDGKRLATAGNDHTVRLWDLEQILAAGRKAR
jgi:WD40 repeat protein